MRNTGKLLFAALVAALTLSLAVGSAAASRGIEVEPLTLFNGTSPEIVFSEPGGASIRCAVTLRGSLHRSIGKVAGTLAGYIAEGRTERCRDNILGFPASATILAERGELGRIPPWHVTYNSFAGILPNITSVLVTVNRARFLLETALWNCLFQGDIGAIGRELRGGPNLVDTIEIQAGRNTARLFRPLFEEPCPAEGRLTGRFTVAPAIRLRLI